jgi:hypothetical protein
MISAKRAILVHATALAVAGIFAGCSADLGTVRFRMPPKIFRFSTASTIWSTAPATLPFTACSADGDCCAPLGRVALDCQAVAIKCLAESCAMTLRLEQSQLVSLLREVPDLTLLDARALMRLALIGLHVQGMSDRLDAPTADLTISATPIPAPGKPRVSYRLGVAPAVPLGGRQGTEAQIAPEAAQTMQRLVASAAEPFYLDVQARVPVAAGGIVPQGEYAMVIELLFAAALGL